MENVFVYWDNSNIFHEAQRLAEERGEGPGARYRVRLHFENLLRLAHADRPVEKAIAAGSVPPEMRQLWNRMESRGMEVRLFDHGAAGRGEQEAPDLILQLRMLEDALDRKGDPGIVALLTGDGAGYLEGRGFHTALERLHTRGWRVEILSWAHAANRRMRAWVEEHGVFVPLDDFYGAITFMEPSRPGFELAQPRDAEALDLSRRRVSPPAKSLCRIEGVKDGKGRHEAFLRSTEKLWRGTAGRNHTPTEALVRHDREYGHRGP